MGADLPRRRGTGRSGAQPGMTVWTVETNPRCVVYPVADYTCQALVSSLIFTQFPDDELVGEEDSSELQDRSHKDTKENIVRLSNEAMNETIPDGEHIWAGVKSVPRGEKEWLEIIDRGNSTGGPKGRK